MKTKSCSKFLFQFNWLLRAVGLDFLSRQSPVHLKKEDVGYTTLKSEVHGQGAPNGAAGCLRI